MPRHGRQRQRQRAQRVQCWVGVLLPLLLVVPLLLVPGQRTPDAPSLRVTRLGAAVLLLL